MAVVHEEVFDVTELVRYVIDDGSTPGTPNLVEVFRAAMQTPGPLEAHSSMATRENISIGNMRVQQFIVGNRYRVTFEDYVP
jgi:hypothetical protein